MSKGGSRPFKSGIALVRIQPNTATPETRTKTGYAWPVFFADGALQRATLRHTIYGTGTSIRLTLDLNLLPGSNTDTPKGLFNVGGGYD